MALEDVVILNVDTNTLETPFDDLQSLPNDVVCMEWLTQGFSSCWLSPRGLTGSSHGSTDLLSLSSCCPRVFGNVWFNIYRCALKPPNENQLMLTWARNPASLVKCCFQMKLCEFLSCDCFQENFKEFHGFYILRYDMKWVPSHSLQSLLEFRTHFLSHSLFLLVNYFMFLITWL